MRKKGRYTLEMLGIESPTTTYKPRVVPSNYKPRYEIINFCEEALAVWNEYLPEDYSHLNPEIAFTYDDMAFTAVEMIARCSVYSGTEGRRGSKGMHWEGVTLDDIDREIKSLLTAANREPNRVSEFTFVANWMRKFRRVVVAANK
jgi:hypothetical protein